jgi:hypothetical protein
VHNWHEPGPRLSVSMACPGAHPAFSSTTISPGAVALRNCASEQISGSSAGTTTIWGKERLQPCEMQIRRSAEQDNRVTRTLLINRRRDSNFRLRVEKL